MRRLAILIIVFLALILLSACSENRNFASLLDPVSDNGSDSQVGEVSLPNPQYHGVWGAWEVNVDTKNLTAEIIPARNAAKIGDIFDADLSQFLTVTPCANCLMISGISFDGFGNLLLGVRMKHPFGNISTRPDLHGFDVRAILIGKWDWAQYPVITITKPDGTEEEVKFDKYFLMNADGYTGHYDELVNDPRYFMDGEDCPANINPYLRFFESYKTDPFDPHNPSGYNVMPVGSDTYERTMVFQQYYPFSFYLIADVAYGQSATLANRTNPQYYLPSFNRTEPWRMEYWVENNTLAYNDAGSSADIVVQVFDWQHSATVDPSYPNPANLSGIKESSRIMKVELVMPDLQDAPIVATIPESGTGTPSDPLQYRLTVHNTNLNTETWHDSLIAIRDELDGSAYPGGRAPIPESPAGFPYATLDIRDYSYYGVIQVNSVEAGSDDDYNNEIEVDPESQVGTDHVFLKATFFMDPSHKKFQYRWDYDYDGITFDVDGGGMPSPEISLSSGKHNVGLRVRTNSVPPNEYIYSIPVYINGADYSLQLGDPSTTWDTTGLGRNQAAAATDEWFYFAYVSRFWTGSREITLGQVKRNASQMNINQVTTLSSSVDNPSIAVVEDGSHAGVYMLFQRDGQIQFMKGELNGTGFNISNIKTVSNEPFEYAYNPVILYAKDTLFAYYRQNDTMPPSNWIFACKSTDWGETWTGHAPIDNTSISQRTPTVVYNQLSDLFYCVYVDDRNFNTQRGDLYLAEDNNGDGLSFEIVQNISTLPGLVDEYNPSMALGGDVLAIVYVTAPDSVTGTDIWLKTFYDGNLYTNNDTRLFSGAGHGFTYTAPSIACALPDRYLIGCAAQEIGTSDFYTNVFEFERVAVGTVFPSIIIRDDLWSGSDLAQANIYPGVAARSVADGNAVEYFAAVLNYDEGSELVNGKYYGQIDMISYIVKD
jgi:hypothetical protein